ncbi:hypothetical protein BBP40_010796, partial [Aspergillus hancockii]
GEFGFLRGAEAAGVTVLRAPRGMSRNKANGTRWLAKNKCLNWTVEWIAGDGERRNRLCLESLTVAEAYDWSFPLPKEEREQRKREEKEKREANTPDQQLEVELNSSEGLRPDQPTPSEPTPQAQAESKGKLDNTSGDQPSTNENTAHRDVFFYLHRPRTSTRQTVLVPLCPTSTLTSSLRDRTVLEFPTIYVLPDSPETLSEDENAKFLLEKDYLRTQPQTELESADTSETDDEQPAPTSVDISNLDERKVLEVLKKDLFEAVPAMGP